MALISTHVLDTSAGRPASGVAVRLEILNGDGWDRVAVATTDDDGRIQAIADVDDAGVYQLVFDTGAYLGPNAFYPTVSVAFNVTATIGHFHVPLLLSPFGYTTYRGS